MSKYPSAKELAWKIRWEGGAAAFIFEYGGVSSQDYPEDIPQEVLGAFMMLGVAQQFIDTIDEWVETSLEDQEDD